MTIERTDEDYSGLNEIYDETVGDFEAVTDFTNSAMQKSMSTMRDSGDTVDIMFVYTLRVMVCYNES